MLEFKIHLGMKIHMLQRKQTNKQTEIKGYFTLIMGKFTIKLKITYLVFNKNIILNWSECGLRVDYFVTRKTKEKLKLPDTSKLQQNAQ